MAAQQILEDPAFENPTVVMLVDRNELETQLFGNLASVGFEEVEVAESKRHLRNLLAQDRRGLIVTMIHKFEGIPADINRRSNIFVLVDEAHRTTGGKLGNFLMGAPAQCHLNIVFTGTRSMRNIRERLRGEIEQINAARKAQADKQIPRGGLLDFLGAEGRGRGRTRGQGQPDARSPRRPIPTGAASRNADAWPLPRDTPCLPPTPHTPAT